MVAYAGCLKDWPSHCNSAYNRYFYELANSSGTNFSAFSAVSLLVALSISLIANSQLTWSPRTFYPHSIFIFFVEFTSFCNCDFFSSEKSTEKGSRRTVGKNTNIFYNFGIRVFHDHCHRFSDEKFIKNIPIFLSIVVFEWKNVIHWFFFKRHCSLTECLRAKLNKCLKILHFIQ